MNTEPTILQAAEQARGSRAPRGDQLSDDHHVALYPPDSRDRSWMAQLVASNGDTMLWDASGQSMTEALTNLCLVLADELEERARYLPEDYVCVQDRPMGEVPQNMVGWRFVPNLADPAHPTVAEVNAGTPLGPQLVASWAASGERCKVCGCTEDDCMGCVQRTGRPCGWVAEDLCSACIEAHTFDPHPLDPSRCAVCFQPMHLGDPVCQGIGEARSQEDGRHAAAE